MSILSKEFREIGDLFIDSSKNITPMDLSYVCREELDYEQKEEILSLYHRVKETSFFKTVFSGKLSRLVFYSSFFTKRCEWPFLKEFILRQAIEENKEEGNGEV